MDIDKVLRKQKKSYKRFMLSMGFIFLLLPIVMYISERFNIFFIIYLLLIEGLILLSMVIRYNEEHLNFYLDGNKLTIVTSSAKIRYNILTDKVTIVHSITEEKYFNIMIVTKSKFRNKRLQQVNFKVLEKYPEINKVYNRVKMPEEGPYFYFIIKKGGIKKYLLLNLLFKYCVGATFTDEAVERIKESIKQKETRS